MRGVRYLGIVQSPCQFIVLLVLREMDVIVWLLPLLGLLHVVQSMVRVCVVHVVIVVIVTVDMVLSHTGLHAISSRRPPRGKGGSLMSFLFVVTKIDRIDSTIGPAGQIRPHLAFSTLDLVTKDIWSTYAFAVSSMFLLVFVSRCLFGG